MNTSFETSKSNEEYSNLMRKLIDEYHKVAPFNGYEEEYKWELLDKTEGKDTLSIIKSIKGENLIDNPRVDGVLKTLWETKEEELVATVNHLYDDSKPIDERIATFKAEMREICPSNWKNSANDERTASALLMCKYPDKYTAYKDEIYQLICNYLGIENRKPGLKFSHYTEIINKLANEYGEEIQKSMLPQIGKFRNKPLNLAIQTFFWVMKTEIHKNYKNYWLTGYSFDSNISQLDRFINDGIWECRFNNDSKIDHSLLSLAKTISEGDIIILKSTATKGSQHNIPFIRIKAIGIVLSNIITSDENNITTCRCNVKYINRDEKDFDGKTYGSYRKTIHKADKKVCKIIEYVNSIIENKIMQEQEKYKEYIELLKENHNLVLTGAPGTGKTFMAQAIASQMYAESKFVQFHPSYDYTDFVEGLRPVLKEDGQMGFERKDGVFKEFCRDAIKNLEDSKKSVQSLTEENSWKEKLSDFIEESIDKATKYKTINGSEFVISEIRNHTIIVHNEQNEKTTQVAVNADEILKLLINNIPLNIVRDIRNYFKRKFGTQPDSYAFAIIKEIRAMKREQHVTEAKKIEKKPFVFIIDEINRGEASKIFGELFYAIDPGYRGKKEHLVQTQYQNLVPEDDVFADGFYVPENVYILATMNDIDRSVESMDFAMRRRFTWKEVTPADTEYMLDKLACADEAKTIMRRLNKSIAETNELGPAYMIGPAYFLKLGKNGSDFNKLWNMNIEPLLKEYLRGFRNSTTILKKFKETYFGLNSSDTPNSDD